MKQENERLYSRKIKGDDKKRKKKKYKSYGSQGEGTQELERKDYTVSLSAFRRAAVPYVTPTLTLTKRTGRRHPE